MGIFFVVLHGAFVGVRLDTSAYQEKVSYCIKAGYKLYTEGSNPSANAMITANANNGVKPNGIFALARSQ